MHRHSQSDQVFHSSILGSGRWVEGWTTHAKDLDKVYPRAVDDDIVLVFVPVLEEDGVEQGRGRVIGPAAAREQELDDRLAVALAGEGQRVRAVVDVGADVEAAVRPGGEHHLAAVDLERHEPLRRLDVLLLHVKVHRRLVHEEVGPARQVQRHLEGEGPVRVAEQPGGYGTIEAGRKGGCQQ